eukprot:15434354-Alexandrium_andersonii.AAC.1
MRQWHSEPWMQEKRAAGGGRKVIGGWQQPSQQQCWYCRRATWSTSMKTCMVVGCPRNFTRKGQNSCGGDDSRKRNTEQRGEDPAKHTG